MMNREDILTAIKQKFSPDIIEIRDKSTKRVYIEIKPESLVKTAVFIFKNLGARFNIASGIDCRRHIEILYHFTIEDINLLISLRVKISRENPQIDSLANAFEAANWIERELHELLGIDFKGHPDLRRLLLGDEWPEGIYPLRADYQEWDKNAIRDRGI